VQFGKFKLHSGPKSYIYFDLRLLVSYPQALKQVATAYEPILSSLEYDLLAAYPYAALPIGTAISLALNQPMVYPRKEAKSYGTGKSIEGMWQIGQRAVLIEDLITTGTSILQAIALVKAAGMQITDAAVLIDREQGGRETLQAEGYRLHSVMTVRQLMVVLEKHEKISAKQREKVIKSLLK